MRRCDAQVLAIWEGTTDVLSLDALRAIRKEDALAPLLASVGSRLAKIRSSRLGAGVSRVRAAAVALGAHVARMAGEGEFAEASARSFALSLSRVVAASLLLEHADWTEATGRGGRPSAAALRWCARPLAGLVDAGADHRSESRALAMDESPG